MIWWQGTVYSAVMFGVHINQVITFVDLRSNWVLSISEFDHWVSLWIWQEKDSKRSKRVHLVIKGFLCFERQDYSMLRNGAKLLAWMELHLKKTERKSNPISGRERPITWSPWPMSVMLKSGRQGAWEVWSYSHEPSCWVLSWMLCEG